MWCFFYSYATNDCLGFLPTITQGLIQEFMMWDWILIMYFYNIDLK